MRRIDYLIMDIASFLWIEKLLTRNQKKCYNYCDYKSIFHCFCILKDLCVLRSVRIIWVIRIYV